MLRITIALLGFAVFGAMFAAAYYQPGEVERELPTPKFRLAPGEMAPDFIEPGAEGENVTVNITVLRGGPIDVFLMNMENLTLKALNGTTYGFELSENVTYDKELSRQNITDTYNFTFIADGENRTALLIASRHPHNASAPLSSQITEVGVSMRYLDTEARSIVMGVVLSAPSILLIAYVYYQRFQEKDKRHRSAEPSS